MEKKNLVIIGWGFAWIRTFYNLERENFTITVIDKSSSMLLKPMLPEVAYDWKKIEDVKFNLKEVIEKRGHRYINAWVTKIIADKNTVELANSDSIQYDYLFVTTGVHKDFWAIKWLEEFWYSVCDAEHAVKLAEAVKNFEGWKVVIWSAKSSWWTRVECPQFLAPCEWPIWESMFMFDYVMRQKGIREKATIDVFTPWEIFFEDIWDDVRWAVWGLMWQKGMNLHMSKVTTEVTKDSIKFEDGTELPADMVIMIPVYKGQQFIIDSWIGDEKWFMPTDIEMRHLDHKNIFSAWDINAMTQPKLGHLAMMQADIACSTLLKEIKGTGEIKPYTPEVLCIMNMWGGEAGVVLSDIYFNPKDWKDIVWHSSKNAYWKKFLDEYMFKNKWKIPPKIWEHTFKWMTKTFGMWNKWK